MADELKKSDQLTLLEACANFTDTGKWEGCFSYPNCGWDLVRSGLVTEDKKITIAGRAALYLAGKGDDPLPDTSSSITFSIPIPESAA